MSAAKHTPGPWQVLDHPQDGVFVLDAGTRTLAKVVYLLDPNERLANARLIAAAPDLLEALRSSRALLERCGPHLQGVEQECCGQYEAGFGGEYMGQREVIPVCCDHPIDLSDHVANELRAIAAAIAKATGAAA